MRSSVGVNVVLWDKKVVQMVNFTSWGFIPISKMTSDHTMIFKDKEMKFEWFLWLLEVFIFS